MTRSLTAAFLFLAGCSPDAVPRTVSVRADSTAGSVLAVVGSALEAANPGLAVQVLTDSTADADLTLAFGSEGTALVRTGLVVVGPPGALPAPTLESALSRAWTIGIADDAASGRAARAAMTSSGFDADGVQARLVPFATTQAALDSVASRATDAAFALVSDALSSTAYSVVYRLSDAEAAPVVLRGTVRTGAPPEAQTLLDSLAAPTAYRAWAAAGFRPPP